MEKQIKDLLQLSIKENKTVMEAWIGFLIAGLILVGVIFRKQIKGWFTSEQPEVVKPEPEPKPVPIPEPEKPTDPIVEPEPLPKPEEPEEEPEPEAPPVVEPEQPKPEPPKYQFVPYRHTGVNIIVQSKDSKVIKIKAPNTDEDLTEFVQDVLTNFESGTLLAPTVLDFGEDKFWTEGTPEKSKALECALHVLNKEYFIIRGGVFYTKAPGSPYGGSVQDNSYSRRRHFRFEDCKAFSIEPMEVRGSNVIDGEVIGTTPEFTPAFWKGGKDNGAIRKGFAAYKMYWEFEHAFDFIGCKNFFVEGIKVFGVWGDGICIGQGNENFIIRNADINYAGRQMAALYNCKDGLIDGMTGKGNRRGGIDFEPYANNGYIYNIEVKNCEIYPMMTAFPALGRGDVSNINIHHNKYQTTGSTLSCSSTGDTRRSNWAFTDNERIGKFGSPLAPIHFANTDNVLVANNYEMVSDRQSQKSASFVNCTGVVWDNNETPNGKYIEVQNSEVEFIGETQLEIIEL